jgi:hypothetical protein
MRYRPTVVAAITGLLLTGCASGAPSETEPVPSLTPPATAEQIPEGASATYFSVACLSGDSIEFFDEVVNAEEPTAEELVQAATMHEREMTVAGEMLAGQEWPESLRPAAAELSGYFQGRVGLAQDIIADPASAPVGDVPAEPVAIEEARQAFSEALGVPLEPPCH